MKILLATPLIDSASRTYEKYPEMKYFLENIQTKHQIERRTRERQLIHFARNGFLKTFVNSDFDYLMFLDDDNPPEELDAIDTLIDEMGDADIISGIVPLRSKEKQINIFDRVFKEGKPHYEAMSELKKRKDVQGVGLACSILNKKICKFMLENYQRPFESGVTELFKTKDGKRHELSFKNLSKLSNLERKDENLLTMGFSENLLFCHRAKYHGFSIKATPKVKCKHIKYLNNVKTVLFI